LFLSLNTPDAYAAFDNVTETKLQNGDLNSLEAILNYLDSREGIRSSTFNLPQDTKLQYLSEPTLIRAADYQRGKD
jgi:hypothetical protein